jgi:hypothetical protein
VVYLSILLCQLFVADKLECYYFSKLRVGRLQVQLLSGLAGADAVQMWMQEEEEAAFVPQQPGT